MKLFKSLTILCVGVFLMMAALCVQAMPERALVGARLWQLQNTTRVEFEFETFFNYKIHVLNHPNRVVVDLQDVDLQTHFSLLPLKNSIIKSIHSQVYNKRNLKVTFYLKNHAYVRAYALNPKGHHSYRLVINITGKFKHPKIPVKPAYMTRDTINGHYVKARDIIVVVDPGHGGKDPGATGPKGIHEKNVVFKIAKDIQHDIDAVPGMITDLTRKGDYYITLRERLKIAREDHADFFVAIHADAFKDKTAEGASVFALSQRGATSEAARWLAEKENYSELGDVSLKNKSDVLRSVLINVAQTATIQRSLQIGDSVVNQLAKVTPLHSHKVEQARFVVLKSPDIPSLLIETGFITNPVEEKLLNSSSYQHKLAKAIAAGIKNYFWKHPPPHTLFSLQKNAKHITVKSGDTLGKFARQFHTSVAIIKRMNELHSNVLRIGQKLLVPSQPT